MDTKKILTFFKLKPDKSHLELVKFTLFQKPKFKIYKNKSNRICITVFNLFYLKNVKESDKKFFQNFQTKRLKNIKT